MTKFLETQQPTLRETLTLLRTRHLSANKRRDTTAIDVPSAAWLCECCERVQAMRVLELGSGFSTWALRSWQVHHPETEIWTIDDEHRWLETTRSEIAGYGWNLEHIMHLDELLATSCDHAFDVVFVDLDNMRTRLFYAPRIVAWTKPGGIIVFDDWHMPDYRAQMREYMAGRGIAIIEEDATRDPHGRYLAWGQKPGALT